MQRGAFPFAQDRNDLVIALRVLLVSPEEVVPLVLRPWAISLPLQPPPPLEQFSTQRTVNLKLRSLSSYVFP